MTERERERERERGAEEGGGGRLKRGGWGERGGVRDERDEL